VVDQTTHNNTGQLSTKKLRGGEPRVSKQLTSTQKRSAEALRLEYDLLIDSLGLEQLIFITFTFADPLPERAARDVCYEKLRTNVLLKNYNFGLTVFGRSETGRPHYHVVAVGTEGVDYRTGFDFGAWHAGRAADRKPTMQLSPTERGSRCRTINFRAEKVSPKSSPRVSPDGQFRGGNGAMSGR
jgi:hypothetical protein